MYAICLFLSFFRAKDSSENELSGIQCIYDIEMHVYPMLLAW